MPARGGRPGVAAHRRGARARLARRADAGLTPVAAACGGGNGSTRPSSSSPLVPLVLVVVPAEISEGPGPAGAGRAGGAPRPGRGAVRGLGRDRWNRAVRLRADGGRGRSVAAVVRCWSRRGSRWAPGCSRSGSAVAPRSRCRRSTACSQRTPTAQLMSLPGWPRRVRSGRAGHAAAPCAAGHGRRRRGLRTAAAGAQSKMRGRSEARPAKRGGRFSRKAATPSLPSPIEVWNIASESDRCASRGSAAAPLR